MEFKLGEIYGVRWALMNLFERELNAGLQYYVARNISVLEEEMERINEVKSDIVEKHGGEFCAEKERVEFPTDEGEEAANEEFQELLEETVNLDVATIELGQLEGVEVTGPQMLAMSKILVDDNPDKG